MGKWTGIWTGYKVRIQTARKDRPKPCVKCGKPILKGQEYWQGTSAWDPTDIYEEWHDECP